MEMKIMFCAESWGAQEAQHNHALVGASGREFAYMLEDVALAPALRCHACRQSVRSPRHRIDCGNRFATPRELIDHWAMLRSDYGIGLTNVFAERPPNNFLGHFFTKVPEVTQHSFAPMKAGKGVGRYLNAASLHHVERLWQEISGIKPNLVVALGNASCWALIDQTSIGVIRGSITSSRRLNEQKVLPTYHPAAVMRQWTLRTTVLMDLTKAKREMEFPEVRRISRFHQVYPTLHDIALWLDEPAEEYSNDIETIIGQISIVGFARSPSESLVIPFISPEWLDIYYETRKAPPGMPMHYWSSIKEEVEAWKLVKYGLEKPVPKTGQNYIYDLSYLTKMGIKPAMCRNDTMLKHHSLFPELPKGLGFLGSVYTDEVGAWKTLTKQASFKRDE